MIKSLSKWTLTILQSQCFHYYIFLFSVFLCYPKCPQLGTLCYKSLNNLSFLGASIILWKLTVQLLFLEKSFVVGKHLLLVQLSIDQLSISALRNVRGEGQSFGNYFTFYFIGPRNAWKVPCQLKRSFSCLLYTSPSPRDH